MTQTNYEEFQELVEQFEPEMSLKAICEQEGAQKAGNDQISDFRRFHGCNRAHSSHLPFIRASIARTRADENGQLLPQCYQMPHLRAFVPKRHISCVLAIAALRRAL